VHALTLGDNLISQRVFSKSFCKRQFPHKFVNLFFVLVIVKIKDQSTILCGNRLLQNDFMNTFCEINTLTLGSKRIALRYSTVPLPSEMRKT